MKPSFEKHRQRIGLLVAATALPLTPLLGQETQPFATQPVETSAPQPTPGQDADAVPVIDLAPPPVSQTAPPPAATATPAPADDGPAEEPDAGESAEATEPDSTVVRTTTRTTRSTAATRATSPAVDPEPAADEPTAGTPVEPLVPVEPVPGLVPGTLPDPEVIPPEQIDEDIESRGALWPWVLAGLLLAAALALMLVRRRRAARHDYAEQYEQPEAPVATTPEPVTASAVPGAAAVGGVATLIRKVDRPASDTAPFTGLAEAGATPEMEPPLAAELAAAPMNAAPVAAVARSGRPRLELKVRPIRAGVREGSASVDFELRIENRGSGPARDVGIATWIYADGGRAPSEAERTLIEHPFSEAIPEIGAGDAHRLQSSAALPIASIEGDSILPVVVVDIRYRRLDGREERTSASFAVGVPLDDELAHFDLENPSGLHEKVEARPLGHRARA